MQDRAGSCDFLVNIATVGEWRLEFSGLWKVRCDVWQGKAIVWMITWLSWYLLADLEIKRSLFAISLVESQKEEIISRCANAMAGVVHH